MKCPEGPMCLDILGSLLSYLWARCKANYRSTLTHPPDHHDPRLTHTHIETGELGFLYRSRIIIFYIRIKEAFRFHFLQLKLMAMPGKPYTQNLVL